MFRVDDPWHEGCGEVWRFVETLDRAQELGQQYADRHGRPVSIERDREDEKGHPIRLPWRLRTWIEPSPGVNRSPYSRPYLPGIDPSFYGGETRRPRYEDVPLPASEEDW